MRRSGLDVLFLLLAREEALDARTHCLDKEVCARQPVSDVRVGNERRNEETRWLLTGGEIC